MAYRNKYGITKIKNEQYDNFSINWDTNFTNSKIKHSVILFTPDMKNTNTHYHISLKRNETKKLNKWLTDFLKDTNIKNRKKRNKRKYER